MVISNSADGSPASLPGLHTRNPPPRTQLTPAEICVTRVCKFTFKHLPNCSEIIHKVSGPCLVRQKNIMWGGAVPQFSLIHILRVYAKVDDHRTNPSGKELCVLTKAQLLWLETCKQEYASAFEGKGVRVKSVVTLCTHFDWSKCLAVQMNCT